MHDWCIHVLEGGGGGIGWSGWGMIDEYTFRWIQFRQ